MQNQNAEQRPLLGSARVVLWDPKGSNRFVVGGGAELKMYEWNHEVLLSLCVLTLGSYVAIEE